MVAHHLPQEHPRRVAQVGAALNKGVNAALKGQAARAGESALPLQVRLLLLLLLPLRFLTAGVGEEAQQASPRRGTRTFLITTIV